MIKGLSQLKSLLVTNLIYSFVLMYPNGSNPYKILVGYRKNNTQNDSKAVTEYSDHIKMTNDKEDHEVFQYSFGGIILKVNMKRN